MQLNLLKKHLKSDNQRSDKIKKNIAASIVLKGISILTSLILIPMTINYLSPAEYGVWLTLLSILSWISFFDIGLGNGLRNRLAETFAKKDYTQARIYVSTAFALLTIMICIGFILFLICNTFLHWNSILRIDTLTEKQLSNVIVCVFALSSLQFILKLTGIVPIADQKPAVNDLILTSGNVLSLICIYILTLTTQGSLFKVAFVFTSIPAFTYLIAYLILFNTKYRNLRPTFKLIRLQYAQGLLGLGVQFFLIQIACMVIFTSSNIIITQLFGPQEVTPYNIAFKYFSIVTMGVGIIMAPIWSAITDAYTKRDYPWIQHQMKILLKIWTGIVICVILMLIISGPIYDLWIGDTVNIPFQLSLLMGVYVIITTWNNIYAFFVNGVGKIRIQMYSSIASCIVFFPLTLWLAPKIGVTGILLAMNIVLIFSAILLPIQYKKIINNTATGIWQK